MELVIQRVELPDGTSAMVAIARDIRERIEVQVRLQRLAQSEHSRAAELNAVIRAMGEAVIVCAADGTISLANPAGRAAVPRRRGQTYEEILGRSSTTPTISPRGRADRRAGGAPDAGRSGPLGRDHHAIRSTSGSAWRRPARRRSSWSRDITEARRREAVRETFIGVLSHELRTPVTTIFGGAKLLARERSTLDEETRRGIFQDIYEEAERLQRLVEDVVALNRFAEEGGEIGWEPVLLQRLVPRVVQSEEARWPGVSFTLEIAPACRRSRPTRPTSSRSSATCCPTRAKYGGPGSTVTLAAEAGDGEVRVRVLDDGPGFPAEETNRLFELFYRSPGTAASATGAGIGLFVCARLVAAMGGRIWAVPRPGGGAEFGFALNELNE